MPSIAIFNCFAECRNFNCYAECHYDFNFFENLGTAFFGLRWNAVYQIDMTFYAEMHFYQVARYTQAGIPKPFLKKILRSNLRLASFNFNILGGNTQTILQTS